MNAIPNRQAENNVVFEQCEFDVTKGLRARLMNKVVSAFQNADGSIDLPSVLLGIKGKDFHKAIKSIKDETIQVGLPKKIADQACLMLVLDRVFSDSSTRSACKAIGRNLNATPEMIKRSTLGACSLLNHSAYKLFGMDWFKRIADEVERLTNDNDIMFVIERKVSSANQHVELDIGRCALANSTKDFLDRVIDQDIEKNSDLENVRRWHFLLCASELLSTSDPSLSYRLSELITNELEHDVIATMGEFASRSEDKEKEALAIKELHSINSKRLKWEHKFIKQAIRSLRCLDSFLYIDGADPEYAVKAKSLIESNNEINSLITDHRFNILHVIEESMERDFKSFDSDIKFAQSEEINVDECISVVEQAKEPILAVCKYFSNKDLMSSLSGKAKDQLLMLIPRIQEVTINLASSDNKIKETRIDIKKLKGELTSGNLSMKATIETVDQLKEFMPNIDAELNTKSSLFKKSMAILNDAMEIIEKDKENKTPEELTREIEEAQKECTKKEAEIERMMEEINHLKLTVIQAEETAESFIAIDKEMQEEIVTLKKENANLRSDLAESEKQVRVKLEQNIEMIDAALFDFINDPSMTNGLKLIEARYGDRVHVFSDVYKNASKEKFDSAFVKEVINKLQSLATDGYDALIESNGRIFSLNNIIAGGVSTQESTTVKRNEKLRKLRTFKDNGQSFVIYNHFALSYSDRVYFDFCEDSQKIRIAYIGKHLETSSLS